MRREGLGFQDCVVADAVSGNGSRWLNSLITGKIQGISAIAALFCKIKGKIFGANQELAVEFPTHRNREIKMRNRDLKSSDQGISRREARTG
jgi:hypothetical protein